MYIRLKWENKNVLPTTFKIYRGTAALDRTNLGTPLVTLTNGELEYIDTAVVDNTVYYYVIESITSNGKIASRNYQLSSAYARGFGPSTLLLGNGTQGFYGYVTGAITNIGLYSQLGITTGTPSSSAMPWYKFIINGIVTYLSVNSCNISTEQILALAKAGGKVITIDGINYKVRLVKGLGANYDGSSTITVPAGLDEFDMIVKATAVCTLAANNLIGRITGGTSLLTQVVGIKNDGSALAQRACTWGVSGIPTDQISWWLPASPSQTVYWFPVLELME